MQLDYFIESKPDLREKCVKLLKKYSIIILDNEIPDDYDPNGPIDQMSQLEIEKNHGEYYLNTRIKKFVLNKQ